MELGLLHVPTMSKSVVKAAPPNGWHLSQHQGSYYSPLLLLAASWLQECPPGHTETPQLRVSISMLPRRGRYSGRSRALRRDAPARYLRAALGRVLQHFA